MTPEQLDKIETLVRDLVDRADRAAAGYRIVPIVDDATRREVQRLVGRLTEISVPSSDADAVIHLGRIQPEPFKSQMVGVARSLTEAQQLTARAAELLAAAYLGRND